MKNLHSASSRIKRLAKTLCLATLLSPFASAFADPMPDATLVAIKNAIENFRAEVSGKLSGLNDRLNDLFIKAFSSLTSDAQKSNLAVFKSYEFTEGGVNKKQAPKPVYDLIQTSAQALAAEKLQSSLSLAPASVLDQTKNESAQGQRNVLLKPPGAGDSFDIKAVSEMLDAQNLFGSLSYSAEAQNRAERNLAFFSDYAGPLGNISLTDLYQKDKGELAKGDLGQQYRMKVYTNAALRSLFLNNLYESFNARVPIKNLGTESGMPKQTDASLAEVEKFKASSRINNENWYNTINNASPIVVQREMVFLLADIQWQLYQLHRDNERMLHTMTAVGIINLRSSNALSDKNERDLQQSLEGTTVKPPDANSTTPTTTIPDTSQTPK